MVVSHNGKIHESGLKTNGEFVSQNEPQQLSRPRICPQCSSRLLFKDGLRYTSEGSVQRFLCRECGYRFSEKSFKECQTNYGSVQICAVRTVKNLDTATESKTVAGDRKLDAQATKGLLLQYTLYLQKEGYDSESRYKGCIRMLINSVLTSTTLNMLRQSSLRSLGLMERKCRLHTPMTL